MISCLFLHICLLWFSPKKASNRNSETLQLLMLVSFLPPILSLISNNQEWKNPHGGWAAANLVARKTIFTPPPSNSWQQNDHLDKGPYSKLRVQNQAADPKSVHPLDLDPRNRGFKQKQCKMPLKEMVKDEKHSIHTIWAIDSCESQGTW